MYQNPIERLFSRNDTGRRWRFQVTLLPCDEASKINDHGIILGASEKNGRFVAGLWTNGQLTRVLLPSVPGETIETQSAAINASGMVAGTCASHEGIEPEKTYACIWPASGQCHRLGSLGGKYSYAKGINRYGHIVGAAETAVVNRSRNALSHDRPYLRHAFLWDGRRMFDLDAGYPGHSTAFAINDAGDIVSGQGRGGWPDSPARTTIFLVSNGRRRELKQLPDDADVMRLNRRGQILVQQPGGCASIIQGSDTQRLRGPLGKSSATDINDLGQVVGSMPSLRHLNDWGAPDNVAFFFDGQTMHDLNDLTGRRDICLYNALGINNAARIVALGRVVASGETFAALLTPVREA